MVQCSTLVERRKRSAGGIGKSVFADRRKILNAAPHPGGATLATATLARDSLPRMTGPSIAARHVQAVQPSPRAPNTHRRAVPDAVLLFELKRSIRRTLAMRDVRSARVKRSLNFMPLDPSRVYHAMCDEMEAAQREARDVNWRTVFEALPNHTHDRGGNPTGGVAALRIYCTTFMLPYLALHPADAAGAPHPPAEEAEAEEEAENPMLVPCASEDDGLLVHQEQAPALTEDGLLPASRSGTELCHASPDAVGEEQQSAQRCGGSGGAEEESPLKKSPLACAGAPADDEHARKELHARDDDDDDDDDDDVIFMHEVFVVE
jgi:hypothetical protein